MASFIQDYENKLKQSHYVRVAKSANNYWFDFTASKLEEYQKKFANKFCLIIQGSPEINDAYIFPLDEVRNFFSKDLIDHRGRWIGSIRNNIMRISTSGKAKSISVSRYYNAFDLLDFDSQTDEYLVKDSDIIKYEADTIDPDDLQDLIKSYNAKYEAAIPVKKLHVSEQVSRPGLIADYIKQLQNFTCQICRQKGFVQSNKTLYVEAHHIIELHKLIKGSFCSDNIIIVCPTCHKKLHYAKVSYRAVSSNSVEVVINGTSFTFNRNVIAK